MFLANEHVTFGLFLPLNSYVMNLSLLLLNPVTPPGCRRIYTCKSADYTGTLTTWMVVLILLVSLTGCPSPATTPSPTPTPTPTPTLAQRIGKSWSANIVKEGTVAVYTKGGAANIKPGYLGFKLNLNSQTGVSLTEFDGNTFTGQWALSTDGKMLTLNNLNPQPTDTGGTISYTINEATDASLKLTRTTVSAKSGGTINDYQLTNP